MTAKTDDRSALAPIDARALSWFVARQAGDADDGAFEAWRAADPRHATAYARVERLWGSAPFARAARRVKPASGRRKAAAATAATLCLMAGTLATLRLTGMPIGWPADHGTRIGEIASVRLDDGSMILLDSASAVDVAINGDRRDVRLLRGRAFVIVADDPRPFMIRSGDAEIRDIGTRFSVAREGGRETVAVEQGVVDLRPASDARSHVVLRAGQASAARDGELAPVRTIAPLQAFGWTRKRLYFSQRPLGEVVDELRRYHRGWIVLANRAAATMPISGGLSLADPDAAMRELARLSGTQILRLPGHILVLR